MAVDWEIVKIALEASQTNEAAAEKLLLAALEQKGCNGECKPGCCGSGSTEQEIPITAVTGEKAVVYGKGGYSDANDPRTPACRSHEYDKDGKPIAVHCGVLVQPQTRYRCVLLDLIPHDESCQVYVEVVGKDGSPQSKTNTRLLTGWSESTKYDALYDAPASPGNFAMGREAKFYPPALGACGAVVVDASGNIDSDIAGSMGISRGTHMSYRVVFRER